MFTPSTLTPNSVSIDLLICGLVASIATRNTIWLRSVSSVAFSVITGARMIWYIASRDRFSALRRTFAITVIPVAP